MLSTLPLQIAAILKGFYVTSAGGILVVLQTPALCERFLDYGPRSRTPGVQESQTQRNKWLDLIKDWTVPHSWFFHFYVVSVCCSLYWIFQIRTGGHALEMIGGESATYAFTTVYEQRVMLCMFFMLVQGMRRLYECLFLSKASDSRMWIGHYLIGLAFYLTINIAIWIEAVPTWVQEPENTRPHTALVARPSEIIRTTLCIVGFAGFSLAQNQVHAYLASLQRYTLPSHALFTTLNVITPHYFFEIGIYVSFAVLTAREGAVLNATMLTAVLFVTINLGVTAAGTKKWLLMKFPKEQVEIQRRRKMVPLVW